MSPFGGTCLLPLGTLVYACGWGHLFTPAVWGHLFNWMGIAILLTTELGLLDACARISTDIIKVNWLRENTAWSENRLYFLLLWGQIAIGCLIMLLGLVVPGFNQPLVLLVFSAALNGGVMFVYSVLLFWLNRRVLGPDLAPGRWRSAAMAWAVLFFGYFTFITLKSEVPKLWQ